MKLIDPETQHKEADMATSLLDVTGIGPASEKLLAEHGITSAEALAGAKLGSVIAVPGFSETRANRVMAAAKALTTPATVGSGEKPAKTKTGKQPASTKKSARKKAARQKKEKTGKAKTKKQSDKSKPAKSKKSEKAGKTKKSAKKEKGGKKSDKQK
jgi:hypothetical protein